MEAELEAFLDAVAAGELTAYVASTAAASRDSWEGQLRRLARLLSGEWAAALGDDGPVTVRVGFAGSAALFADLPRLKNVSDAELEEAAGAGDLRVEWVGRSAR